MENNWSTYLKILQDESKIIQNKLSTQFQKICTTRLHPDLISGIKVLYFEEETAIKNIANIQISSARSFLIKPFDKSLIPDIEKAIRKNLNDLNPIINDASIIINFPPPTEESRKASAKESKELLENSKVELRKTRKSIVEKIKNNNLPEDVEKKFLNNLEIEIKKESNLLDEMYKKKESELMTI